MTTASLASVHQQFEAALPAIRQSARYALRRRRHDRDDLIAEIITCSWKAWHGLVKRRQESPGRRRDWHRRLGRSTRPQGPADRQSRRRPWRDGHFPSPRPGDRLFPRAVLRLKAGHSDRLGARILEGMAGCRSPCQPRRRGVLPTRFRRPGSRASPHGDAGRRSCSVKATARSRSRSSSASRRRP